MRAVVNRLDSKHGRGFVVEVYTMSADDVRWREPIGEPIEDATITAHWRPLSLSSHHPWLTLT